MVEYYFLSLTILLFMCVIIQAISCQGIHPNQGSADNYYQQAHELAPAIHEGYYGPLLQCINVLREKCGKLNFDCKLHEKEKLLKGCFGELVKTSKRSNTHVFDPPFHKDWIIANIVHRLVIPLGGKLESKIINILSYLKKFKI